MAAIVKADSLNVKYLTASGVNQVLDGLSFSLEDGKFTSIVGPSGCGKTTILRCVAGLQKPNSGSVTVMGKQVVEPVDEMTIVFQEYNRSLLPWRNVLGNVTLGIERRVDKTKREKICKKLLEDVGLAGFERHYPWQLSGGMQQRVAIARALAPNPKILLMDEPFASVDAQTRMALEDQLLLLWKELNLTVLFVTHDIDESVYLSQRVLVLNARPTRIIDEVDINLEFPRSQIMTRQKPEFASYRTKILEKIKSQ